MAYRPGGSPTRTTCAPRSSRRGRNQSTDRMPSSCLSATKTNDDRVVWQNHAVLARSLPQQITDYAMTLTIHGKAALIVNELQSGIIGEHASFQGLADHARSRGVVANVARLLTSFRTKGWPVVHVPVAHRTD